MPASLGLGPLPLSYVRFPIRPFVSLTKCDCHEPDQPYALHNLPGVLVGFDGPCGIQRCDDCVVYEDDGAAAAAVAHLIGGLAVWPELPFEADLTDEQAALWELCGPGAYVARDGSPVVVAHRGSRDD